MRVAPFALTATGLDHSELGLGDAARRPAMTDGPLWTGRDIAPGVYRVLLDSGLNVSGRLTIALGTPDRVLQGCSFSEHRPGATECMVDLPAGATWLWMTPDTAMRSSVEGIRLQVMTLAPSDSCSLRADRAVVTDAGEMYAQRGSGYAESSGLWVVGGKLAQFTIKPRRPATLHIRNGPKANRLRFAIGAAHDERRLTPGETLDIPLRFARGRSFIPVTVWSETGFRPADLVPETRDLRYLGIWVEMR
jgi:hypothetical protein